MTSLFVHHEVVAPFAENSYLIGCATSGRGALVDPGGHVAELLAVAAREGLGVDQIWLTHAHLDHVSGIADAVDATGAPVYLHPDDRPLYDAAEEQARFFGMQIRPLPEPARELAAGEVVQLGDLEARVLLVPGHSPGHVAFWFEEQRTVLSGDCLFAGSIGRTDLPGGSYEVLMDSLLGVLCRLGPDVRVLSGHGPETTIGQELATNPFLVAAGRSTGPR